MRAVVQRVKKAMVTVEGRETGRIGHGLVVLLGIGKADGAEEAKYLADKILGLRIFEDEQRAMNRSIAEVGGEILLVSQFTLYGDCRRGRRPSFDKAASGPDAETLYRRFAERLEALGRAPRQGVFGAKMEVSLLNDGPVTLLLDTEKKF